MKYHFRIHEEPNCFWAECIELEGCVTQGSTLEELDEMMAEALNLYLDEPATSKVVFPFPMADDDILGDNIQFVTVHPEIVTKLQLKTR